MCHPHFSLAALQTDNADIHRSKILRERGRQARLTPNRKVNPTQKDRQHKDSGFGGRREWGWGGGGLEKGIFMGYVWVVDKAGTIPKTQGKTEQEEETRRELLTRTTNNRPRGLSIKTKNLWSFIVQS